MTNAFLSSMVAALMLAAGTAPAAAQVSIGPNGIRSGGTVIDSHGVHTPGAEVTGAGVATSHRGGGIVLNGNGRTRTIDCSGGAATVQGNSNILTIHDCRAVTIDGNHNRIDADYARPGRLSVLGNRNIVRWHAAPRVRVAVSNVGTSNTVAHR